jgi:hypothetical protein
MRWRRFSPTSELRTSSSPSCSGAPTWSVNSSGAAPVPPSAPSTTMKSGTMPVSSIALQMANHSQGWPMHSLKPVGLPPDSCRRRSMNCIISMGVENALCAAGLTQSTPTGTPRAAAISGVTLGPGSTPPWPGLAPWLSLSSIIFTCGSVALATNLLLVEAAVVVAAAEVARADLPDQVAAVHAVVLADRAFTGVVRESARAWRRR